MNIIQKMIKPQKNRIKNFFTSLILIPLAILTVLWEFLDLFFNPFGSSFDSRREKKRKGGGNYNKK